MNDFYDSSIFMREQMIDGLNDINDPQTPAYTSLHPTYSYKSNYWNLVEDFSLHGHFFSRPVTSWHPPPPSPSSLAYI